MQESKQMDFSEKFVAFVDILGFTDMVKDAECGNGKSVAELVDLLNAMAAIDNLNNIRAYGPIVCPESRCINRDLDFQVVQVSDCIVVSCEVSPAGIINLVNHCWIAAFRLLKQGILCRGYITKGSIYHDGLQFFGSGYVRAFAGEKDGVSFKGGPAEKGTPFIELDTITCDYIAGCGDSCVQKQFSRLAEIDGDLRAIFPFKRLSHTVSTGSFGPFKIEFDPSKERASNNIIREAINAMKEKILVHANEMDERAMKKTMHYLKALDSQLANCDWIDESIDKLLEPFPELRFEDL